MDFGGTLNWACLFKVFPFNMEASQQPGVVLALNTSRPWVRICTWLDSVGSSSRVVRPATALVQVETWSEHGVCSRHKLSHIFSLWCQDLDFAEFAAMELWEDDHIHVGGNHS